MTGITTQARETDFDQKMKMSLGDIINDKKKKHKDRQSLKRKSKVDSMRGITTTNPEPPKSNNNRAPKYRPDSVVIKRRMMRKQRNRNNTTTTSEKITISITNDAPARRPKRNGVGAGISLKKTGRGRALTSFAAKRLSEPTRQPKQPREQLREPRESRQTNGQVRNPRAVVQSANNNANNNSNNANNANNNSNSNNNKSLTLNERFSNKRQ